MPRALYDAGFADKGEIIVLEPRRLATRLAARRVADELGQKIGEVVGYQVRFEDVSSARTRIRFVTEGVLTRRLLGDPDLRGASRYSGRFSASQRVTRSACRSFLR